MESKLKLSEERQHLFNLVLSELEQKGNLVHEKKAIQHGSTTVYEHSVGVAGASLKLAELFHIKVNEKALVRVHFYMIISYMTGTRKERDIISMVLHIRVQHLRMLRRNMSWEI